jgi:hypothetical protein
VANDRKHDWQELARVIPWQEEDHAPEKVMPEPFYDGAGEPRTDMKPPRVEPHIILQDLADPEKQTKVVPVPEKQFQTIKRMLETGEMDEEDLSRLPLHELVPDAAKLLSPAGRARSGVARGVPLEAEDVDG